LTSEPLSVKLLGHGTLHVAEEARRKIGPEFHDDTAQCRAAVLLRLQLLGRTIDPKTRRRVIMRCTAIWRRPHLYGLPI
jgi:hypothetical protein